MKILPFRKQRAESMRGIESEMKSNEIMNRKKETKINKECFEGK